MYIIAHLIITQYDLLNAGLFIKFIFLYKLYRCESHKQHEKSLLKEKKNKQKQW